MPGSLRRWWRSVDEGAWIYGHRQRGDWLLAPLVTAVSVSVAILFVYDARMGAAAGAAAGIVLVVLLWHASRQQRYYAPRSRYARWSLKQDIIFSLGLAATLVLGAILLLIVVLIEATGR